MKQREMIETIQQQHPEIGETQIRLMLNRAIEYFDDETELLTRTAEYSGVDNNPDAPIADKRRYSFHEFDGITSSDEVIKITRVDYNNKPVKRFIGEINETDVL